MTEDKRLKEVIDAAHRARERAYVPYSRFKMGAAVLTEKDVIVQGSLVENVSLGLAMCAERIALFSTIAQDAGKPELLVLVSRRTNDELTFPCGACLQVALELGGYKLQVVACDPGGAYEILTLHDLVSRLPYKG